MILSNLLIVIFFFILLYIFKHNKIKKLFIDDNFLKPQSYHKIATPRIGGSIISFSIIFYLSIHQPSNLVLIVFSFSFLNYIIGTIDDLKIITSPSKRFILMIISNSILIYLFELRVDNFGFYILDYLNNYNPFAFILVLMAIFFIINGANLIDGFNGLLSIHSIIILSIIIWLFGNTLQNDLKNYLYILLTVKILFCLFNFPKSNIFLGDGGAYFIGANLSVLIILLSSKNIATPFFFANILFYMFFEIFFSVFRKIIKKKNPFLPDKEHLHMLLYNFIKNKKNANPVTSVIINTVYFITILPSIIFYNDEIICLIIFIFQIFLYFIIYYNLKKFS
ncbi:UDP-N-acetylmuramyl pentapeptide phosphotransferase/UDP-N-acetylglucosamine-1-phosphate transferase [alpha proteobacterium HIMB114]|nr:UDP-N-acetylmuramyl pentapeptide phosphotransferase/UDP-N-acetylglucosamine-1-phosphate transferase [alpha proteobacterium HIMB114]